MKTLGTFVGKEFFASSSFLQDVRRALIPPYVREPSVLFRQLASLLVRIMNAQTAAIWDNNIRSESLVLHAVYPDDYAPTLSNTLLRRSSLAGIAINKCDLVTVHSASADYTAALNQHEVPQRLREGSAICVPVPSLFNPQLMLLVLSLYYSETRSELTELENEILRCIASGVSLGLDHVLHQVHEDIRYSVARAGLQARGIRGLFELVSPELQRIVRAQGVSLLRWDASRCALHEEAAVGSIPTDEQATRVFTVDSPGWLKPAIIQECAIAGRGVIMPQSDASIAREGAATLGPACLTQMAVPVHSPEGEVLAVLYCSKGSASHDHYASSFTSLDYDALEAFGRSLSVPIHRFLRLRQQSSLRRVLGRLAGSLATGSTTASLLQEGIRATVSSLKAEFGCVYLLDENRGEFKLANAVGPTERLVGKASYCLGEGITGWVGKEGQLITFRSWKEISCHPAHKGKYDLEIWGKKTKPCASLLVAPMVAAGKVLGVWQVGNIQPSADHPDSYFTDEDVQLAGVLSSLFAMTVVIEHSQRASNRLGKLLACSWLTIAQASSEQDLRLEAASAMEQFGIDGLLSFWNAQTGFIEGSIASGPRFSRIVSALRVRADGDNSLARALRSGDCAFVPDSSQDVLFRELPFQEAKILVQYVIPLKLGEERIGILQVDMGNCRTPSEDDTLFLKAFAGQLAISISRIRAIASASEMTSEVMSGSRFIIAETLASASVHSAGHMLDSVIRDINSDLKRQEIRQNRIAMESLESWKSKLLKVEDGIKKTLNLVRTPEDEGTVESVDLHSIIQGAISIWYNYIRTHNCSIAHVCEARHFSGFTISSHALREIVSVLLVNAVQAFAHHIRVTTLNADAVRLANGSSVQYAFCMDIADDGQGLQTNDQEIPFSSTYTTKPRNFGTGLGLFIARTLARRAEGDIMVLGEGLNRKGVTFRLVLPVEAGERT